MRFLSLVWLAIQLALLVYGSQHGHQRYHGMHHQHKRDSSVSATAGHGASGTSSERAPLETFEAADMVARALQTLKSVNKLRLEHVQYNQYEFATPSVLRASGMDAAPLTYSENTVKESNDVQMRDVGGWSGAFDKHSYSIPPELREAARIMAEAAPQFPPRGNHSAVTARMRSKYGTEVPDTRVPAQVLQGQNLHEFMSIEMDMMNSATGGARGRSLEKRVSSSWWMATMEQRGFSPFSPAGYKVRDMIQLRSLVLTPVFSQ